MVFNTHIAADNTAATNNWRASMEDFQADGTRRNVERIRAQATLVVRGRIPAQVRTELREAVKNGWLGHLKKDGLKPEIFFHPDHKHGAIERQKREAEYSIGCIATVIAVKPVEQRVEEAIQSVLANR
jgi:hypothetical protein